MYHELRKRGTSVWKFGDPWPLQSLRRCACEWLDDIASDRAHRAEAPLGIVRAPRSSPRSGYEDRDSELIASALDTVIAPHPSTISDVYGSRQITIFPHRGM